MTEPTPSTPSTPGPATAVALDQSASGASYDPPPGGGAARRFWSVRRVPTALVALVVLGGAGVLLYDVAAVRAGRPSMSWRRAAAQDLAGWRLDEPWVLAVAAAVTALGLCLVAMALTPGLRWLLPMRRDEPSVRAGLARDAAALVLRDRAMEVPGVQSVRVSMGRSKVAVRARSHFRELDDVRTDVDAALAAAIVDLGLAKPPALNVRVSRTPAKKR
ncbi:DUF6286 domain-containing protein [Streptomyces sp. NPDC047315]|uniref:DUF6286 domain-containing protein n=1 Tax=Streptomyces sp. NPDC047315 TaxID=3155142 RepID=UPI0033E0D3BA